MTLPIVGCTLQLGAPTNERLHGRLVRPTRCLRAKSQFEAATADFVGNLPLQAYMMDAARSLVSTTLPCFVAGRAGGPKNEEKDEMMLTSAIPVPKPSDDEEVSWALSTAAALWTRGSQTDERRERHEKESVRKTFYGVYLGSGLQSAV